MFDQLIGMDEGWTYLKEKKYFLSTKFFFSTLVNNNFLRYVVTVFLDLFISSPLQDILKIQIKESFSIHQYF